jgi:protein-L-isoaspartate O-methyltransferase
MSNITATYSPEDNKLRLYSTTRLDSQTYNRVKEAGFKWAPKQELFVAPMWTPTREDLCVELAGEIGDEDTTLVERAEAKAERLEDLSERRAQDADRAHKAIHAIADGIPFGQPILVGHHSERHARKDAEKIENGMRKAVECWKAAQYWQDRAKGAIRLAKYKERPDVRARRIKGLEADKRKEERTQADAEKFLKAYEDPKARTAKLRDGRDLLPALLKSWEGGLSSENQQRFSDGAMTFEDALQMAANSKKRIIAHAQRWIDHYTNRIAYERAMLDEQGGTVTEKTGPEKGGAVRCWCSPGYGRGWSYIVKVNKVSVSVLDNWGNGGANFTRTVPFTDLKGVITKAEVDAARAEGRLMESENKQGFYLTDPTPTLTPEAEAAPVPEPTRATTDTRAKIEEMQSALKAGFQVIAAPQLFPTPPALAERMVEEADIQPNHRVLEPSAGTGAIVDAIRAAIQAVSGQCDIEAVEINPTLAHRLAFHDALGENRVHPGDFLEQNDNLGQFDRIVMNPPFENGADIKHIQHAMKMLKPGGRLVAICANGPRQQTTLKPLAENSGGWYEDLPAGTFASQGTNVNTALLLIEN